jgi:hypothetical protein
MRAKLINENIQNFERGGEPFKQLDIGNIQWENIKEGDIIQCIKEYDLNYKSFKNISYPKNLGNFAIIKKVIGRFEGILHLEFISSRWVFIKMLKDIWEKMTDIDIKTGYPINYLENKKFESYDSTEIIAPIKDWKKYFKIIQPRDYNSIKESFNRDDPNIFKKLGIGIKNWEKLKVRDILIPKKDIILDKNNRFSNKGSLSIFKESYVLVTKIDMESDGLEICYFQCWDFKEALDRSKNLNVALPVSNLMVGSIKQYENRFKIYEG